jgi:hypothetical protein
LIFTDYFWLKLLLKVRAFFLGEERWFEKDAAMPDSGSAVLKYTEAARDIWLYYKRLA